MTTEAQKRARNKWNKENTTHVQFVLSASDAELVEYMKDRASVEGKAAFFRRIMREDMERRGKFTGER